MTVHFIDTNWKLNNFVLDFVELDGPHTGENLAGALLSVLENFGIDSETLLAVVTDNATNNDTLLRALQATWPKFNQEEQRVRCVAHIIHLAVVAFLTALNATPLENEDEEIEGTGVINKLRKVIVKIRSSPQRRQKYLQFCRSSGLDELMVILDVKTRWYSTYEMICRAVKMREAIDIYTSCDADLRDLSLQDSEWELLSEILNFLKVFEETTKFLCQEKFPTIQYVVPVYNYLLEKIQEFRNSSNSSHMRQAVKQAQDKISTYYDLTGQHGPLSEVYGSSIILDPTLKLQFFKDRNWTAGALKLVREKTRNVYITRLAAQQDIAKDDDTPVSEDHSSPLITQLYKRRKLDKRSEYDQYLALPVVPFEANGASSNKLSWWKANGFQFPVLSTMARDYLAIPATSSPSERAFSNAKNLIGIRYSLEAETVRKCMCLKEWLNIE